MVSAPQATNSDSKLIDSLTYMASLASNPDAISPMLDDMRVVTSQMQSPDQPLSEADKTTLLNVRQRLSSYLINEDPVRAFNEESLAKKLEAHSSPKGINKALSELLIIVFLTFAIYLVSAFLLPGQDASQRFLAASPIFAGLLNAGVGWFFITSRQGFSEQIRKAYGYFCSAMVISIIVTLQFPILSAFPELRDTPLFRYGGLLVLFLPTCFLFYWGLRTYALQVNKPSIFTRLRTLLIGSIAIAVITLLLPHAPAPENYILVITVMSQFLAAFYCLLCFLIGMSIVRSIAPLYAKPIKLLAFSLLGIFVCFMGTNIVLLALGPIPAAISGILSLPFAVPQFLELAAAYYFKKSAVE